MDKLAADLNEELKKTKVYSMLSDYGRRIYIPKGIIVQSGEAKKKADKYNATIGVALEKGTVMYIPSIREQFSPELEPGELFPYSPMGGNAALRELWKKEMFLKNPSLEGKKFSMPLVCSGLTNALSLVCSLFLDKGDSVVLPSMYWENYDLILDEQIQAEKVLFDNFEGQGFNVKGLDKAIASVKADKVAVLLNFPNNPTGYTPTNEEADAIAAVLCKYAELGKKLIVITDDAYFGLFFEENVYKESLFAKICDTSENLLAVKCDAATKEEMVWGFRLAFITYGFRGSTDETLDALTQKTMGAIRGNLSNCSTPGQNILLKGMTAETYHRDKQAGIDKIGRRYHIMKKALAKYADKDSLKPYPFNSGYFMSFYTKCDAEALRQELLNNWGTGAIRLGDHLLRLAFSSIDAENIEGLVYTVYKAAEKLC
ncbi:MAG: aminotransferase class I/II-fold pyridoxal phosphate-dependent enzyme [Sphaerochaeta sp.]